MLTKINAKVQALRYRLGPKYKKSFSQCGEDIIVARLLRDLGIKSPFYIDIGSNDPVIYSNTYLFYMHGSNGVCIEPNPLLCKKIRNKRPRDLCLEVGIGLENGSKDFFVTGRSGEFSTFLHEEAVSDNEERKTVRTIKVEMQTISSIIQKNDITKIDFMSLDAEGMDAMILKSFDFSLVRPKIICVETKSFGDTGTAESAAQAFMKEKGYELCGMTPINSIFVDRNIKAVL